MRSGIPKFKQMRHFAMLACLSVVLMGCAAAPATRPSATASASPGASASAAPDNAATLVASAKAALDKGDLRAAQADMARASMLGNDPHVAERATVMALALHDGPAARKSLRRWEALGGDRLGLLRARARLAMDEGRTDDARRLLMDLTSGGQKRAWQQFGAVLLNARDAAQAGQLLEQVGTSERLPDDVHAWLAMSQMGQKLGRYAYAQRIADMAASRFHDAEAYAWAANMYAQRDDSASARQMFARGVKAAPDDVDLRLAYAAMLAKDGDLALAGRVMARGRQDERSYAARAAYAARARNMPALRSLYGELRRAPASVQAKSYYLLGQLAALIGKPAEAVDWLARVPADADHGLDAGLSRASMLLDQHKPDQAHALVAQLREHFAGEHDKASVRRLDRVDAELYMRQGEFARAAKAYTHALAGDSESTDLLYGRGLAYAEAGNTDAAISDLRAVLKRRPDDINAVNALGYTLADADRQLDEATRLLQRARKAQPDDPAIADSWGWLQYRLGHLDQAETTLRASWSQRKDPEVGAHLARVLLARGKKREAGRIYRAALRLDPHNRQLQALKGKL